MNDQPFEVPFPDRVDLLLEQRSRLLDSLILANHKLDEKADRAINTGSIVIGLLAFTALLPLPGPFELPEHIRQFSACVRFVSAVVCLLSFCLVVIFAVRTTRPLGWLGSGDTDWINNSTRYLGSDSHKILLADLLETIDSVLERNDTKANEVMRISWLLAAELIAMAISIAATLLMGSS